MPTVTHTKQCPACAEQGRDRRGNHFGVFEDGGGKCVVCGHWEPGEDRPVPARKERKMAGDIIRGRGEIVDIPSRKISADTCRRAGYLVDGKCHIAPYHDEEGNLVAQKVRNTETKNFKWYGDPSKSGLFGQHLYNRGGRRIIVTEGEIDCLSVYQTIAAGTKSEWAVVSVRNGAGSQTLGEIQKSFDYLNSFEEVVFCFDMDGPGQESALTVAKLFPPGKAHITSLRHKDPNEYLMKGKTQDLWKDLWNSPKYVPQGIISVRDIQMDLDVGDVMTYSSPVMTAKMLGRKLGTMTMCVSGTGSGKTTWVMDQVIEDLNNGIPVGGIFLEASPSDTLMDLAGLAMACPVRRILTQRAVCQIDSRVVPEFRDTLDDEELERVVTDLRETPLHLYNHFGEGGCDEVLAQMEYMVQGLGCKSIILDHLSLVQPDGEDTNKGLEKFVKKLQQMTKRLPAHFLIISQLSQAEGKSHEEGKVPVIRDIRGSQMIPACMDEIISLTRNQQADTEEERNTVYIHSLKGRLGAHTGLIETRQYNKQTGRLSLPDYPTAQFNLETIT